MIIIENNLFLRIEIDGKELPSSSNLVDKVIMTEGNGALSPAIKLVLNDHNNYLQDSRAITDGNSVIVTVGKEMNTLNSVSRQYRIFGHKQHQTASGPQISAVGIYDAPAFLTGSAIESSEGTTSELFKKIAAKCLLKYSGPEDFNGRTMTDSQIWRNVCKSRAAFCSDAAIHGRIDDHSAMYLVLTSLGILKYRNLMDVIERKASEITRSFVHNTVDREKSDSSVTYSVQEARDRSLAGLMNNWHNYGSTRIEHSLSGTPIEHKSVDVKTAGNYLPINEQISRTVDRSRIDYAPLDCGNTFDKYQSSMYQNKKLLSLFCERLSVLTYDVTDVQLLDPVIYRQSNEDVTVASKNYDVYLVIGKTVVVEGGRYYAERIELCRMSLTKKGESALKTADTEPQSDRMNKIPDVIINPTASGAKESLTNATFLTALGRPALDAATSVQNKIPVVDRSVVSALPALKAGIQAMQDFKTGQLSAQKAVSALRSMLPALNLLKDSCSSMSTSMTAMKTSVNSLSNDLQTSINPATGIAFTSQVQQSLISTPGGIYDTFAASFGSLKQQQNLSRIVSSVNTAINDPSFAAIKTLDTSMASELNACSSGLNTSTSACTNAAASQWNDMLRVLTNSSVPATYVSGTNATNVLVFNSAIANVFTPSTSVSRATRTMTESTKAIQTMMLKKTSGHEYPWLPTSIPVESTSFDNVQQAVDQATFDSAYSSEVSRDPISATWSA